MAPRLSTSSGVLTGAVQRKALEKLSSSTKANSDTFIRRGLVEIEGCDL